MENIGILLNLLHMGSPCESLHESLRVVWMCVCCKLVPCINIHMNIRSCACCSFGNASVSISYASTEIHSLVYDCINCVYVCIGICLFVLACECECVSVCKRLWVYVKINMYLAQLHGMFSMAYNEGKSDLC